MRAIRQLQPLDVPQTPTKRKPKWNAVAGAVFAVGTVLTIAGLLFSLAFWYLWDYHDLPPMPQIYIDSYVLEVNDATAPETLEMWKQTVDMKLAPYETSPEVEARRSARFYVLFIPYGFIAAAIGLLIALSAFFFR